MKFFRFLKPLIIGFIVGTVISYNLGLYNGFLWEQSENRVAELIINKAETLSIEDGIILDNISQCMADMFISFAIVRECNYELIRPLDEQIIICTADNLTIGDKAMIEGCIVKVLGSQGENFKDTL